MKQIKVSIGRGHSKKIADIGLIVSYRNTGKGTTEIVVGYPGLPNVIKKVGIGDAVLFESPSNGIIEVRVLSDRLGFVSHKMDILVSQVSPRLGILAGPVSEDPNNSPFTRDEIVQIADSISITKSTLAQRQDIAPEQLELIARKLDEIQFASERLGRKDWINYVAGTLTSMCISAAFSPEVTKAIFQTVNSAFAWLFASGLLLISN
jgi:hypothetical protein